MDEGLALRLCALTGEFYRANAESFSQTRRSPWQGWVRLLEVMGLAAEREPLCVLDLACGNLRFERYLADALPNRMLSGYAVDNCDPLVEAGERNESDALSRMSFQNLDAIERLSAGCLRESLEAPDASCDLAVSFGFMHHVPLERWRARRRRLRAVRALSWGFPSCCRTIICWAGRTRRGCIVIAIISTSRKSSGCWRWWRILRTL